MQLKEGNSPPFSPPKNLECPSLLPLQGSWSGRSFPSRRGGVPNPDCIGCGAMSFTLRHTSGVSQSRVTENPGNGPSFGLNYPWISLTLCPLIYSIDLALTN